MDWRILFASFWMIFVAELGDKTQFAVFAASTQHGKFWPVLIGSSMGLITSTLIAVVLGLLLGRSVIPEHHINKVAGALFVGIGLWLIFGK